MDVILTLLILTLTLAFWFIRKKFSYWRDLGVHQFPITLPEGNIKGLGKKYHVSEFINVYYQKIKAAGKKFAGVYVYLSPILIVTDLELVKTILVKDFNVFPNRGGYFNEKDDPLSGHIFSLENDPWRHLRQKLSPTFTSGKLKMMFSTIVGVSEKLLEVIEKQTSEGQKLNVKDVLARFTTDVIGTTAFGIDCNSLDDAEAKFYKMGAGIFKMPSRFAKRVFQNSFRDLARKLHMKSIPEVISSFYIGITRETIEYREKNPQVKRQDFMNLLVQLKKSGELTVEQIAAQSFIFFLAGFETSSTTMSYCTYELSVNEEIQEKARQSVIDTLKKHNNEFTYEAINDMDYLEQCVSETLRKYPVVSSLQRVALRDYKIPDTDIIIPKDQPVWIPIHGIQWDPELYPQPEKFDPDRFTPEEIAKRHQYAYIPFGEGPRICIGMRFGLLETKIGLAKMLLNYKFTLDRSRTSVPLKMAPDGAVLTSTELIYVSVEKIKS